MLLADEPTTDLNVEVDKFVPVVDRIALGDLGIRERFAGTMLVLFVATNAFVLAALGVLFWFDHQQLAAGLIAPDERIVDTRVVIALLGATTVQLGAVIYTMSRAIFPLSLRSATVR